MPSDFCVSNLLSQVGDRSSAFEILVTRRVSYTAILVSLETVIGSKQLKIVTYIAGCKHIIKQYALLFKLSELAIPGYGQKLTLHLHLHLLFLYFVPL